MKTIIYNIWTNPLLLFYVAKQFMMLFTYLHFCKEWKDVFPLGDF